MPKISLTAQIIQDLFFQDYTSDESFIKPEHIRYLIGGYYNIILNADYEKSKRENQIEVGIIYPTVSSELIRKKDYDVKKEGKFSYIELDAVVNFPYDNNGYGVAFLRCLKDGCGDFKRTTVGVVDKLYTMPYTNTIWWFVEGNRVNLYSAANIPSKVLVGSIPAIDINDDDFEIPQSFETQVINSVLDVLKRAASGVTVDMSNNSNPNAFPQTELDNVFRNLKTKPN